MGVEIGLVIVAVTVGGFLGWRFRRRHSGVPRGWQTAQSHAADLHRRLHRCIDQTRRAVARAGGQDAPVDKLIVLTGDLDLQARAIDAQLVAASRLPSAPRERALRDIRYRVIEVEKLATRVDEIAVEFTSPVLGAADAGLADLRLRLDALDEARREAHEIGAGAADEAREETRQDTREETPEERPGTAG